MFLYGQKTWTILEEDLQALRVSGDEFKNYHWRCAEEQWRMNHDFAQFYGKFNIMTVEKTGRMRCVEQVVTLLKQCQIWSEQKDIARSDLELGSQPKMKKVCHEPIELPKFYNCCFRLHWFENNEFKIRLNLNIKCFIVGRPRIK